MGNRQGIREENQSDEHKGLHSKLSKVGEESFLYTRWNTRCRLKKSSFFVFLGLVASHKNPIGFSSVEGIINQTSKIFQASYQWAATARSPVSLLSLTRDMLQHSGSLNWSINLHRRIKRTLIGLLWAVLHQTWYVEASLRLARRMATVWATCFHLSGHSPFPIVMLHIQATCNTWISTRGGMNALSLEIRISLSCQTLFGAHRDKFCWYIAILLPCLLQSGWRGRASRIRLTERKFLAVLGVSSSFE